MKEQIDIKQNPILATKTQMQAGRIIAPEQFDAVEVNTPEPQEKEVRIKMQGSGLCASNLPLWEGRDWFDYPIGPGKPGHEGWGIIDAVGPEVDDQLIGKRVTALTYKAFAQYDTADEKDVVILPNFLSDKPFPGEPLGCAMNIYKRTQPSAGEKIAVIGCGFLGLLLIQLLKDKGCEVLAISRRNFSLEKAEEMGADQCIKLDEHQRIIQEVKNSTNGDFCAKTIECTGKEWPLNLGIQLTKTRGKLVVAGYHQDGMRSVNIQLLNWRGIDMISAHERNSKAYIKGIKEAIVAIEEGRLNPFPLFTHKFSMEELGKGFTHLKERPDGFIKGSAVYENND